MGDGVEADRSDETAPSWRREPRAPNAAGPRDNPLARQQQVAWQEVEQTYHAYADAVGHFGLSDPRTCELRRAYNTALARFNEILGRQLVTKPWGRRDTTPDPAFAFRRRRRVMPPAKGTGR
jgi:hypothetical protein